MKKRQLWILAAIFVVFCGWIAVTCHSGDYVEGRALPRHILYFSRYTTKKLILAAAESCVGTCATAVGVVGWSESEVLIEDLAYFLPEKFGVASCYSLDVVYGVLANLQCGVVAVGTCVLDEQQAGRDGFVLFARHNMAI